MCTASAAISTALMSITTEIRSRVRGTTPNNNSFNCLHRISCSPGKPLRPCFTKPKLRFPGTSGLCGKLANGKCQRKSTQTRSRCGAESTRMLCAGRERLLAHSATSGIPVAACALSGSHLTHKGIAVRFVTRFYAMSSLSVLALTGGMCFAAFSANFVALFGCACRARCFRPRCSGR